MKNKELLNICYKLFNRFITVDELIKLLDNIDKKTISDEELSLLNSFINDVKTIATNTPNTEDEYVKNEKKRIKESIERFEKMTNKSVSINDIIRHLKEDYEKELDSYERWLNVFDYINKNDYFNECYDNLTDYELLEFIAQNIKAPFPPKLSQEEYERLVKVGIEKDEREWLWRLAHNYGRLDMNLDSIVNYFIEKKDAYYLTELISAVGEFLDINSIINRITDKELIEGLLKEKQVLSFYVKEEQFNKLISKLN